MKIRVIITGSTGMVGKGVLLECLKSPDVESVLVINRRPVGIEHEKLKEVIHKDFFNLTLVEHELKGYNTCYFCLGVSSFLMSEADYTRLTYDLTLNFAKTLLHLNPEMVFTYVSGAGTDNTEKGRSMWARVKGKTENDLLALPFEAAWMFRPGYIQPMKGIKSGTRLYNAVYTVFKPAYPVLKAIVPDKVTTTVQVGRAMIKLTRRAYEKKVLHSRDINALADSLTKFK